MSANAVLWAGTAAALALAVALAGQNQTAWPQPRAELIALTAEADGYLAQLRLADRSQAADGGSVRLVGLAGGLCHAASTIDHDPGGDIILRFPAAACLEPLGRGAEVRLGGELILEDARRMNLRLSGRVAG